MTDGLSVAVVSASLGVVTALFTAILLFVERRREVRRLRQELDRDVLVDRYITAIEALPNASGPAIADQEISARLAAIEARFPDPETLAQVATVNEAVLAVRVDQLQRTLDGMDKRLLGRGDVVTLIFAVISALGVLVGLASWAVGQMAAASGSLPTP